MHRELTGDFGAPRAVHARRIRRRAQSMSLERAMAHVRTLATLGRAAREEAGIKVRQPLARLVCVVPVKGAVAKDARRGPRAVEGA